MVIADEIEQGFRGFLVAEAEGAGGGEEGDESGLGRVARTLPLLHRGRRLLQLLLDSMRSMMGGGMPRFAPCACFT